VTATSKTRSGYGLRVRFVFKWAMIAIACPFALDDYLNPDFLPDRFDLYLRLKLFEKVNIYIKGFARYQSEF
jgi:hypothetical protein